jgi:hypothetical protein
MEIGMGVVMVAAAVSAVVEDGRSSERRSRNRSRKMWSNRRNRSRKRRNRRNTVFVATEFCSKVKKCKSVPVFNLAPHHKKYEGMMV